MSKRVRFEEPKFMGHETIELQQMVWRCEGCNTSRWMRGNPKIPLKCHIVDECEECEGVKASETWRVKGGPVVGFGAHHNED